MYVCIIHAYDQGYVKDDASLPLYPSPSFLRWKMFKKRLHPVVSLWYDVVGVWSIMESLNPPGWIVVGNPWVVVATVPPGGFLRFWGLFDHVNPRSGRPCPSLVVPVPLMPA